VPRNHNFSTVQYTNVTPIHDENVPTVSRAPLTILTKEVQSKTFPLKREEKMKCNALRVARYAIFWTLAELRWGTIGSG
jgi:hypothetical protein